MKPPAPLRVLMVSQYADAGTGGAERYAAEVGWRLEAQHGVELQRLSAEPPRGVSPPRLRAWSGGYHPAWPRQVAAALAALRPHVTYVHHTVPGLADVASWQAARHGVPAAVMYHSDVTGEAWPKRLAGRVHHLVLGRGCLRAADVVFVASASYAAASPALRQLPTTLVEAAPGVDPTFHAVARRPGRYVLFVGKPDRPHKGLATLLAAWRRLRCAQPELELRIAGGDRAQPTDADGVRWLGQVASRRELARLYAGAHALVLPSVWPEPFGMVAAEALAAGCPVVASDVGGVRALVEDGCNGRLVPPGDAPALAAALEEVLRDGVRYRRAIAERADAYARRFDWDATAATVAGELRRLAAPGQDPVPAEPSPGPPRVASR